MRRGPVAAGPCRPPALRAAPTGPLSIPAPRTVSSEPHPTKSASHAETCRDLNTKGVGRNKQSPEYKERKAMSMQKDQPIISLAVCIKRERARTDLVSESLLLRLQLRLLHLSLTHILAHHAIAIACELESL